MSGMWTRGGLFHRALMSPTGLTYDPQYQYTLGPFDRGGTPSLLLPPEVIAADPSDPSTWTKPLILT